MKGYRRRVGITAIVLALVGVLVFSGTVFAQGPDPNAPPAPPAWRGYPGMPFGHPPAWGGYPGAPRMPGFMGRGRGPGFGHPAPQPWRLARGKAVISITAEVLEIEPAEVISQLREGKSIAEIAGDKLDAIVERLVAPRQERLETLVADGRLTQEQADALLALMKARITDRLSQPFTPRPPRQGLYGPGCWW